MKRKRLRYNRRKVFLGLFLFLCLIAVTLGYAFVNTNLSIDGTARVKEARWNVHFNNLEAMQDSVEPVETPTVTNTSVTFSTKLDEPGDFYGFTIDVVNEGSINADISNISITPDFSTINYIDATLSYSNDDPIQIGDILAAGKTKKLKVLFEYKDGLADNLYPIENQTFNVTITISYEQYTENPEVEFNLGDYFRMIPSDDSYTIIAADTGYSNDQVINPRELNLWRVIDIHNDGSVDAISEYTSSNNIYFSATRGYANLVGGLQELASKYENSNYTIDSRIIGYDGQTLTISDTTAFDGTYNTYPSTTSTPNPGSESGQEYDGGSLGDSLYIKDYQLVSNVYSNESATYGQNGMIAYKIGTSTPAEYWLGSRFYGYFNPNYFIFSGRFIGTDGNINGGSLRYMDDVSGTIVDNSRYSYAIRPIITLKPSVMKQNGSGTKTNPYIFE